MTPDPTARLRLDTALDQLLNPETQPLDRDHAAARALLREANRDHLNRIRELARRLRAHPHDPAIRRDLRAAGQRHRARRAALAANLATTIAEIPSLLERLDDAITSTGGTGNASRGVHRSPLNSSAVEVLADIRRTTGHREGQLAATLRAWQPTDIEAAADRAEHWVAEARAIVTPARWTEAKRPCPACGTRHVWITEDGQRIRKAAIQVNLTEGFAACCAPACSATWPRERFELLAAALAQEDVAS